MACTLFRVSIACWRPFCLTPCVSLPDYFYSIWFLLCFSFSVSVLNFCAISSQCVHLLQANRLHGDTQDPGRRGRDRQGECHHGQAQGAAHISENVDRAEKVNIAAADLSCLCGGLLEFRHIRMHACTYVYIRKSLYMCVGRIDEQNAIGRRSKPARHCPPLSADVGARFCVEK